MDLVNHLPLAADLSLVNVKNTLTRLGFVVAKATFNYQEDGSVDLDKNDPFPINQGEVETELGQLPRDILPISDGRFEVLLLGRACAQGGGSVPKMKVALSVGDIRRELVVFGNRTMERGSRGDIAISPPQPFREMPLTWKHAFGGTSEVLIDKESYVHIIDVNNPVGRGFDPGPQAEGLCKAFKAPKQFPVYDKVRHLPNVESPKELISAWDDKPNPACWAPMPFESAVRTMRALNLPENLSQPQPIDHDMVIDYQKMFKCAHTDWILNSAPMGARICMEGLSPSGTIGFQLPTTKVFIDYVLGAREGIRELTPQMLVLLPEEKRFYIIYRHYFSFEYEPGVERCMRLRMERGV